MSNTLFNCCGDDFQVWESKVQNVTYYNLSIEGYMGYDKLKPFVDLYEQFKQNLCNFLVENNYEKTEKHRWSCIYQTRAIEICYEHNNYWIFLDTYKSDQIWDLYYYMEDVIDQIKEQVERLNEPH